MNTSTSNKIYHCFLLPLLWLSLVEGQILKTDDTWTYLDNFGNAKWSPRNVHASCVFKGKLWVTGGRSDSHPLFNLEYTFANNDVWWSEDGTFWTQVTDLRGDFYAQNDDALQPGPAAPWYPRFGHSLNSVTLGDDEDKEIMILAGGYAPNPMNDVWITEDGSTWAYAGTAAWSPRAWHGATKFNGTLWIMGGTPVTNDIWVLKNIRKVTRPEPLTRAMFLTNTYEVAWEFVGEAAWSPRAAMGIISQYLQLNGSFYEGYHRMVLIGGYGGYLDERFDGGLRCRSDVWASLDGRNWTLLSENPPFGSIAWFGFNSWNPNVTIGQKATDRLWVAGGGFIGNQGNKEVLTMQGSVDVHWSFDGITWVRVNFKQGGGATGLALYSSNEWARTTIQGSTVFLGVWGHTLEVFIPTGSKNDTDKYPNGALYFIGGDQVGAGVLLNDVFRATFGLRCQQLGISCSGHGKCNAENTGCDCELGYVGEYCTEQIIIIAAGALRSVLFGAPEYALILTLIGVTFLHSIS